MSESGSNGRHTVESLLSNELAEFCKTDSLSEEGLRKIIEQHGLTPNNNHQGSDYRFFRVACKNERVTGGIIQYLLQYFPAAASATFKNGCTLLHVALLNKNVTFNIVRLLIDAAPESVHRVDNDGWMPLHYLCHNRKVGTRTGVDESVAIEILKLLIIKHPESVRHADDNGVLPIHLACVSKSPEFCRVLLDEFPGSDRIANVHGMLPLHHACVKNTVATVEHMYKLYPDAINHAAIGGRYPIHFPIMGLSTKMNNPTAAVDIVKFLLDCDPNVKLQTFRGTMSLLRYVGLPGYNDSNIETGIKVIEVIYDSHPEAIENDEITSNIHRFHQQLQKFLTSQLVYSRQAKDRSLMTTPDENGQLPLHRALQNNVRLGSIKLLVKGNPSAIRTFDNIGTIPLHLACQYHESASVIQYLVGMDARTLHAVDYDNNTALHYACRGAKHETIALLLGKYDAVSVSKRNAHKKLPIDLLIESNGVSNRESVEYTESIFRLLKAYPETVMNICAQTACPSQNGKKRKFGNV